jgi:hypothetical protein
VLGLAPTASATAGDKKVEVIKAVTAPAR